ncbi:MAG: trypsin-like peptidase domain-containing protein [Spirochaetes bacterium]|jgi:serine protease Do|nr:trypsin-like peptidase domain-containing protein [Spirochaetota bacterium]
MKRKLIAIPSALILILAAIVYFSCKKPANENELIGLDRKSPLRNDSEIRKAWDIQKSFRKVYTLYEDRVVFISTEDSVTLPHHPFYELFGIPRVQKQTGLGSGFIISEDGFICTNFHVIAPQNRVVEKITVIIENDTYEAEVRGFNIEKDITILKIEPKTELNPVFFGDSDTVQVGDWAIAIGNPFGLSKSFTVGVVSATGRKNIDMADNSSFIQTDAAINPGNSGGPLLNIHGEVIGINRLIYSKSGGYMGIGFAIPVNSIKELMIELKDKKYVQKGFIGIALTPIEKSYADKLGWSYSFGILVAQVQQGGPAYLAGIRPLDIVYAVNGKKISNIDDFVEMIEKSNPGDKLKIGVWRNGRRIDFFVETTSKPAE